MFTKIHGLGLGPSITMLLGNTHGPLREDEAEPERETRKYKPVRSEQGLLAELWISFVYYVESTLLIHSWCIQSFRYIEFSSRLNTLFPHILWFCIFTCTHWTFLMQTFGLMFPQNRFPSSLCFQPAWEGTGRKSCPPSVWGPALPYGIWKWSSIISKWVALTKHLRTWKELLFPIQLSKEAKGQGLSHYLFQPIFPSLLEAQTKVAHAESCRWISNQAYSCTYLALKRLC